MIYYAATDRTGLVRHVVGVNPDSQSAIYQEAARSVLGGWRPKYLIYRISREQYVRARRGERVRVAIYERSH